MRAVVFRGIESLAVESVAEPGILESRDAIVEVEVAGLCGSDLHPWAGRETGLDAGTIMGHEFVGRVIAVGDGVSTASGVVPGARVVAPFTTSCGDCAHCRSGLTARCIHGQLFGWVQDGAGLHGAQAERVRVPLADATLVPVPDTLEDPALALFAGDILSTALFGCELAGVAPGDDVAVVGCGPVGLLAIRAAFAKGAARVFAIDRVPSRLEQAEAFGAVPVDLDDDPASVVLAGTGGLGAHAAIEAVGHPSATRTAAEAVRFGGRIGAVGVHTEPHLALSPAELYDRNLAYAAGRCPARRILPDALALLDTESERLAPMITHRLPLDAAPDAYRRFAAREAGWVKVVFHPHGVTP